MRDQWIKQAVEATMTGRHEQAKAFAQQTLLNLALTTALCVVGQAAGSMVGGLGGTIISSVVRSGVQAYGVSMSARNAGAALDQIAKGDIIGGSLNLADSVAGIFASTRACFRGKTKVLARGPWGTGYRRIDQLRVGDEVLSRDENDPNGPLVWKKVEAVFKRSALILRLHLGGQTIDTTDEHPFYVYNKGWLPAHELKAGDLLSTKDGPWVAVEGVKDTGEWDDVYNVRVAEFHTYFVGDENWAFAIWAHNLYEVGPYNRIRKNSLRNVREANHAPQTRQAELLIGGGFNKGKGISISLPKEQHDIISFWQSNRRTLFGQNPASARELLSQDVRLLRMFSGAPRSALRDLIGQVKALHTYDFLPLHRM